MNNFDATNYPLQGQFSHGLQPPVPQMSTRLQQTLDMYAAKKSIEVQNEVLIASFREDSLRRMCLVREDAKVKRSLLATAVKIGEDGTIRHYQELLTEPAISYVIVNACLVDEPVLYAPMDGDGQILLIRMSREDRKDIQLYLNIESEDTRYYSRKFRLAGLSFKKKRGMTNEILLDIVDVCCKRAQKIYLPTIRGFSRFHGNFLYAGCEQQIWGEAKALAK